MQILTSALLGLSGKRTTSCTADARSSTQAGGHPHLWVSLRASLKPQLPLYQLAKTGRGQKTTCPLKKGHYSLPTWRSSSSQGEKAGRAGKVGGNENKKDEGVKFHRLDSSRVRRWRERASRCMAREKQY